MSVISKDTLSRSDPLGNRSGLSLIRRYQALLAVSETIVSNRDLNGLLRELAAQLRRIVQFDEVRVDLHDDHDGTIRLHTRTSPHATSCAAAIAYPVGESAAGWVWQSQCPLIIPDVRAELRWSASLKEMRRSIGALSIFLLPLTTARRRLGTLSFVSRQVSAYDGADLEFSSQVANQVAMAIENGLALREIQGFRDKLDQEKMHVEQDNRAQHEFDEIVGESAVLRSVLRDVETVAPTDATVLIRGETGTGKELIARAVHQRSTRCNRRFVKVNCAAIPTGLLESELFGHEKGAFTGAVTQRVGRFELAHQGTLFLDEVGDIPLELQPKLLRVLQDQEFERLGSTETLRVNVRVMAATNRDLAQMVTDGRFRNDLYYRLHVFPVLLPSLRDRREDIPRLVRHFCRHFAGRMGKCIESIAADAMAALTDYKWPGNIRELENLIERAVILSTGPELHVPLPATTPAAAYTLADASVDTLAAVERQHILRVLGETKWVLGGPNGAAARLGVKRSTLQWKLKKLEISRPE
jgi:formate hydrogenlyase transcriptional activator